MYVQVRMLKALCSLDAVFAVESTHHHGIDQDQNEKDVNRTLLGEPKTKGEAAEVKLIERLDEDDAETEGDNEPDPEQRGHQA
jgi:hypothetical protein